MTVAVHISLSGLYDDLSVNFNYTCFTVLAEKYPQDHFIFIFDRPFDASNLTHKNITAVLSGPQIKNTLLQYYFYNFKIPGLLNKYRADIFVSAAACSFRTKIPQLLIIHDLSFLQKNNLFSRNEVGYLKKYTPLFFKKATRIAVMNSYLKKSIEATYAIVEEKISILIMPVAARFQPISYEGIVLVKEQIANGKEYFLYLATPATSANIITTLKAFSIFKKWQKSNMQLIFFFSNSVESAVIKELGNYKYKADVKVIRSQAKDDETGIVAAAYACIYLPSVEIMEPETLLAPAAAIPLITIDNGFCQSIYKDAAVYTSVDEKNISDKMMLLYKDESWKTSLTEKGKILARSHTPDYASNLLWSSIQSM